MNIFNGKWRLVVLAYTVIGFLTYFNSLHNQFVWDDFFFIRNNYLVSNAKYFGQMFLVNTTAGAGGSSNYYRPVTSITFGLDQILWGWNVIGFHLTNIFLHIFNATLIFSLLSLLKLSKKIAFWVSLFFLVHPASVEAVAYLSSRGDLLYTTFLLISFMAFIAALSKKLTTFSVIFSLITYVASLLAKETAIAALPIYMAVAFVYHYSTKLSLKKFLIRNRFLFSFFLSLTVIIVIYIFFRLTHLNFSDTLTFYARNDLYGQNLFVRILTFTKIIWLYMGIIFWPHPLYLERDTAIVTSVLSPWVWASFVVVIGLVIFGLRQLLHQHNPWIIFGLIFFVAGLIPVSGLITQTYLYHENWLYLPMVGVFLILFTGIFPYAPTRIKNSVIPKVLGVIIVTFWVGLSVRQNFIWHDAVSLFTHNLKFAPTTKSYNNLGAALMAKGDYAKASQKFRQAINLDPKSAQPQCNLATAFYFQKQLTEAEKWYVACLNTDPTLLSAYPKIVTLYQQTNQLPKAIPYLKNLVTLYPTDPSLIMSLGVAYWQSGNKSKAEEYFRQALFLSPSNSQLQTDIEKVIGHKLGS